jgi:hypothetical protein
VIAETKVGMARCAVPAAFSGGTLRAWSKATNPSLGEAPIPRLHGAGTPQRGVLRGVPTAAFVQMSGLARFEIVQPRKSCLNLAMEK